MTDAITLETALVEGDAVLDIAKAVSARRKDRSRARHVAGPVETWSIDA